MCVATRMPITANTGAHGYTAAVRTKRHLGRKCTLHVSVAGLMVFVSIVAGCQSREAHRTSLALTPDQYDSAFEAALDASNDNGFDPSLRDRRRGIIETEPVISASVFEPWRAGSATFGQLIENTTTLQRRRIIWEFSALQLPTKSESTSAEPDVLAMFQLPMDLTTTESPMELRVVVVIERAASPGVRPSTWTTRRSTRTIIVDPMTGLAGSTLYWTPVARDSAFESVLLTAVQTQLNVPPVEETPQ